MPELQTATPDQSPTPVPPPQQTPDASLQKGLGVSFGDVMGQISPFINSGPSAAMVQQASQAQGDVLKEQQKQKIAEAQGVDEAMKKYGSSADQAVLRYNAEMAAEPLPAFVPTKATSGDLSMLGSLVAIVGFMVGKGKGMQPGLAALDSMTGMLEGWTQGRKDLYDRELKTFKENFDRLRVAHEEYMQQLKASLDIAKVDLQKGLADAQLAAAKAGDSVVLAQVKAGNLKAVMDAMSGQQGAMLKAAEIAGKLYQTEAQNIPLDPATMDYWVKRIRAGDPMPALGFGAVQLRKQLLAGVAQSAINTGSSAEIDQAAGQIRKANEQALAQITRTRVLIENYEQTAIKSSYLVEQLAGKAIGPSGAPALNKWIQAGRRATGDADVVALNNSITTLTSEYAKVMSGGYGAAVTPEGAQERAQQLISEAQNMEQIKKATALMRQEMEFRRTSLLDEQKAVQTDLQNPGTINEPPTPQKYSVGQIIEAKGKKYRVIGGDLNNDPDIEEVK